jgi:hypothetical protein
VPKKKERGGMRKQKKKRKENQQQRKLVSVASYSCATSKLVQRQNRIINYA